MKSVTQEPLKSGGSENSSEKKFKPTSMPTRPIKFEKNYNGKADCDNFIHIAPLPKNPPSKEDLAKTTFQIIFTDNSHDPILVKCTDIVETRIGYITNTEALLSHGMRSADLIEHYYLRKQLPAPSPESKLGIYFYKKIRD
jgi:hypothetical protein